MHTFGTVFPPACKWQWRVLSTRWVLYYPKANKDWFNSAGKFRTVVIFVSQDQSISNNYYKYIYLSIRNHNWQNVAKQHEFIGVTKLPQAKTISSCIYPFNSLYKELHSRFFMSCKRRRFSSHCRTCAQTARAGISRSMAARKARADQWPVFHSLRHISIDKYKELGYWRSKAAQTNTTTTITRTWST